MFNIDFEEFLEEALFGIKIASAVLALSLSVVLFA